MRCANPSVWIIFRQQNTVRSATENIPKRKTSALTVWSSLRTSPIYLKSEISKQILNSSSRVTSSISSSILHYATFDEIFTPENAEKINDFKFRLKDYKGIINDIKRTAFLEFDNLVKSNGLVIDYLDILDKVLLFSKSFVEVDYKSYGQELGVFAFDRIEVDDRQLPGLQITTLMHELSHFLLKEILAHVLCKLLDCTKNSSIDAISTFILVYSPLSRLIDEYCAHSVEGRFTVYGYQDYSSFLQIQKSLEGEMPSEEIEIAKSIGNTFSISIKEILEAYLDDDLRDDIKTQFKEDVLDMPKYDMLAMENCNKLKSKGFMQAIWLILSEGFEVASVNIEKLEEYKKNF